MRVFIPRHNSDAGLWIYNGYFNAWRSLGFEVSFFDSISEIKCDSEYFLMCVDAQVNNENLLILERSRASFIYAQPNVFPKPWVSHPNFQCHCHADVIKKINQLSNTVIWTFSHNRRLFSLWKKTINLPLAFDDVAYRSDAEFTKEDIDVCFIGGAASNGFNTKIKIINDTLREFEKSGLKCRFHVNELIPHEKERSILLSSKIAINIHDEYQRVLGLDTNERTFKSLGCCGFMVSDRVECLNSIFEEIPQSNNPEQMVKIVKEALASEGLEEIKEKNKRFILQNHTYKSRIKKLLHEATENHLHNPLL